METCKVRAVVRVRPKLPHEEQDPTTFLTLEAQDIHFHPHSASAERKTFQFDAVYDESVSQYQFFEQAQIPQMIQSVLDGYHATIFAYGQTGSGKTFTMEGYEYETPVTRRGNATRVLPKPSLETPEERLGIVPRTISAMFEAMNKAQVDTQEEKRIFKVKCSFVQIYNENIYDLLNPNRHHNRGRGKNFGKGLRLRWTAAQDFYVENLFLVECESPSQVIEYFQSGIKQKIMAAHQMNAASSRSHCAFTLYVESYEVDKPDQIRKSKMTLVDLAGSERVAKTGAHGTTLQESIGINKSLFVLRQVVQALAESNRSPSSSSKTIHIPYRDSKITSILKQSLGGNSITLMVACCSPSDRNMEENLSTLSYASQAQSIANQPVKNEDPNTKLIRELREEIASLKHQLAQAQQVVMGLNIRPPNSAPSTPSETPKCLQHGQDAVVISAPSGTVQLCETCTERATDTPGSTPTSKKETKSTNSASGKYRQLKMDLIDNVELIKGLYANERNLRQTIEKLTAKQSNQAYENHTLNNENQKLRERIQILEYLVASNPQSSDTATKSPANPETPTDEPEHEIPGYGSVSSTILPQLTSVPSQTKLQNIIAAAKQNHHREIQVNQEPKQPSLKKKGSKSQSQIRTDITSSGSHSTSADPRVSLASPASNPIVDRAKRSKRVRRKSRKASPEAGSLSVDDLKRLLSPGSAPTKAPVLKSQTSQPPPAYALTTNFVKLQSSGSDRHSQDRTTRLLAHEYASTSSHTAVVEDPIQNVATLGALLRQRAVLKHQSP